MALRYTYICYVEPDSQYIDIYLGEMCQVLLGAFGRFIFHPVRQEPEKRKKERKKERQ
jgi:hypothetical protein